MHAAVQLFNDLTRPTSSLRASPPIDHWSRAEELKRSFSYLFSKFYPFNH
jgi:hypothetical protein